MEPGDSVHIRILENGSFEFSGKGYEKFQYKQELIKKVRLFKNHWTEQKVNMPDDIPARFVYLDSLEKVGFAVLDNWKDKISPVAYTLLKADILGFTGDSRLPYYTRIWKRDSITNEYEYDSQVRDKLSSLYMGRELALNASIDTMVMSRLYWFYLTDKIQADYTMLVCGKYKTVEEIKKNNLKDKYLLISTLYDSLIKQKLLTYLLMYHMATYGIDNNLNDCVSDYLNNSIDPVYKQMVKRKNDELKIALQKGAQVPDFNLLNANEKDVNLRDFKGKVIILDFWFTGCSGCAQMAPYLDKIKDEFKDNKKVVFINISVDKDKNTWLKSVENGTYGKGGSACIRMEEERTTPLLKLITSGLILV